MSGGGGGEGIYTHENTSNTPRNYEIGMEKQKKERMRERKEDRQIYKEEGRKESKTDRQTETNKKRKQKQNKTNEQRHKEPKCKTKSKRLSRLSF